MTKRRIFALASAMLLIAGSRTSLHAQATPTASRGGLLQVGGGLAYGSTDEYTSKVTGVTGYATFDINPHIGAEFDAHFMALNTPDDYVEKEYLIGARYVWRRGRLEPYGKVLFGIGTITAGRPNLVAPGLGSTLGVIDFGGGLDLRFAHHINVRAADFELEKWPGFQPHGLSPYRLTVGVAYRFH